MPRPTLARPVHLVLDYDGTLTVRDTMAVLGNLAKQPKMTWQGIVDAYMADFAAYNDTPYQWNKYDRAEYSGWLAARKWVEEKSARRVQDVDFFKGVTLDEVESSVKKHLSDGSLRLRNGWAELFQLFMNSDESRISILSVNWSATSIRLVLLHAARDLSISKDDIEALIHFIESIEIHANEIEGLRANEGSSGRVCGSSDIRTSDDKLRYLPQPRKGEGGPAVVYVGDSSTDFDSLCAANLGVWLYDVPESAKQENFKKNFAPFDRSGFIPLSLSSVHHVEEGKELFYWSPGFEQLISLLLAG